MLDPAREKDEKGIVAEYFRMEEEEYEVEDDGHGDGERRRR